MAQIISPTKARANLFKLIKNTNRDSKPVIISGANENKSAVMMSKRDYDAQQETMALILNGQLKDALARKNEKSVDLDQMIKEIQNKNE